ncbi:AraC family transcriptional regulator [Methyloligella sp. 2.7D]|uniref:helix-turn-helix domain-containing protein n=1 Tax=unclassified Methyloligella TaxID=2625955 RepID=UPI00157D673E|nr:AraC family transcriptional regulator [Methyloligella sp. GL2]QKP78574.1 helix-turn-helix transcriptional regulator [Methyloligella sp. GL2]
MLHPIHSQLYVGSGRSVYCGPLQHLEDHIYGSAVLHVGIYGPFKLKRAGGDWQSYRMAVTPPGLRHALDVAGGVHGKIFVEADSPYISAFCRRFPYRRDVVTPFADRDVLECFRWIYEEDPAQEDVEARLDRFLPQDVPQEGSSEGLLDARIRKAVALMLAEPDRNHTEAELCSALGLSASRVQHLFSAQTGVPFRRYRMWKRLWRCAELLHQSDNMTFAAVDSGFSDATHFSRCFRDTFGINPAFVFRKIDRFDLLV